VLLDELADFLDQCVETCAFFVDHRRATHESHEGAVGVLNAHSCRTFATFNHHLDLPVLLFLRLENAAERANPVDLLGSRLVDSGIVLCGQENRAIRRERLFERPDRPERPILKATLVKGNITTSRIGTIGYQATSEGVLSEYSSMIETTLPEKEG
jgi:hypothetical protein